MNVIIRWRQGSTTTDITTRVISYEREQHICSGIATINLVLYSNDAPDFHTWDRITIWEEGNRKGYYWINEVSTNTKGELLLSCQDGSKRLIDYFVTESYYIDYDSYTRGWIVQFLEEAGVTYQFDVESDGVLISNNTTLGPASAYEIIQTLLQMSGWYFYFDSDNICHIGTLTLNANDPTVTLSGSTILSFKGTKDDKMLRNRAVVWGNGSQDDGWVFADLQESSPWTSSANDVRTVVLSNGAVRSTTVAYQLARRMLDEFNRITYVKVLDVAGEVNVELGNVIRVNTRYFKGEAMITSLGSSVSKGGLITHITLDERCPRLFAYYGYEGFVYIGTKDVGVWRKHLGEGDWAAFTTGLDEFQVNDLIIKSGVYACAAGQHGYINTDSKTADWHVYNHAGFVDADGISWPNLSVNCLACDIDEATHHIYFGYTVLPEISEPLGLHRAWIDEVDTEGTFVKRIQIYLDLEKDDFELVDIDKHGTNTTATAIAPANYAPDDLLFGRRICCPTNFPTGEVNTLGVTPGDYNNCLMFVGGAVANCSSLVAEGTTILTTAQNQLHLYSFDEDDNIYHIFRYMPIPFYNYSASEGLRMRVAYWDSVYDSAGNERTTRNINIVDVTLLDYGTGNQIRLYNYVVSAPPVEYPVQKDYCSVVTNSPITLYGYQTIDGFTLQLGHRVLVNGQTDPKENGTWVVTGTDWVRSGDTFDYGAYYPITSGDTYGDTVWILNSEVGVDIVVGESDIHFSQTLEILSEGVSLVSDSLTDFDEGYSKIQLTNLVMRDGVVYIEWKASYGDITDCFIGVYNGGLVKDGYAQLVGNVISPWRWESPLLGCGYGTMIVRFYIEVNNYPPPNTPHTGSVTAFIYQFAPDGSVNIVRSPLATASDAGLGDWQIYHHPLHGVDSGGARGVYLGGTLEGGYFIPYIRFNALLSAASSWQNPPGLEPIEYNFIRGLGVLRCSDGEIITDFTSTSDTAYPTEDFDYGTVQPVVGRGDAVFIYAQGQIWNSISQLQTGQLVHWNGAISGQTDDLDGGFYCSDTPGVIYKESHGGGVIAELRRCTGLYGMDTTPGNGFVLTNSCFISQNPGNPGGYFISKVLREFILQGMDLCYLIKDKEDTISLVDFDLYKMHTEENKGTLMSFTTPPSLIDHSLYSGYTLLEPQEHLKIYDINYQKTVIAARVNDLRAFDAYSNMVTASGVVVNSGRGKFILTAGRDGTLQYVTSTHPTHWYTLAENLTTLGNTEYNKVETSNYYYPPHLFATMSGTGLPEFFERLTGVTQFTDYTSGMPSSEVTVIRLDDRI